MGEKNLLATRNRLATQAKTMRPAFFPRGNIPRDLQAVRDHVTEHASLRVPGDATLRLFADVRQTSTPAEGSGDNVPEGGWSHLPLLVRKDGDRKSIEWVYEEYRHDPSWRGWPVPIGFPAASAHFTCSPEDPFRILYVSTVAPYKHQWQVVEAVVALKRSGYSVALDLIGPAHPASLRRLRKVLEENDSEGSFIRYLGAVPYPELPGHYLGADAFVYASSCENLPNILLEAMASGLPIACSNRGPMPEVLGDAGIYFDPEQAKDIARALRTLIEDTGLMDRYAKSARDRARLYTWERTARETFDFLVAVARGSSLQREVRKG